MDPRHLLLPNRPPGDTYIYNEVFRQEIYDRHYTLTPTDIVLDIGAHAGFFSWKAAQTARQIFAFEPSPDNFKALETNTGQFPHVRRHNFALGSYEHTADLWLAPNNSGGHSLHKNLVNTHTDSCKVRVKRLDDTIALVTTARVSFIKIDAEGAEAEIIKGGYGLISHDRPAMVIEIHNAQLFVEVGELLTPLRYELIGAASFIYCTILYAVPLD